MRAAYLPKDNRTKKPAAFLDRDGTLVHDREGHYLTDPAKMRVYAGAAAALRRMAALGYRLIVLTNQSGVGRGYMTLARSKQINLELTRRLAAAGARVEGVYFCPHLPDAGCSCRKPGTGLIKEAARGHNLDLKRSVVIGDKKSDLELARAAGLGAIFVSTGHGGAQLKRHAAYLKDFPRAASLAGAAAILERNNRKL